MFASHLTLIRQNFLWWWVIDISEENENNNNMEIIFPHVFWKWKQNKRLLKPSPKVIHPNKNTSFFKDVHPCTFQTKQNTGHKHTQNQHTMHTLFWLVKRWTTLLSCFLLGKVDHLGYVPMFLIETKNDFTQI